MSRYKKYQNGGLADFLQSDLAKKLGRTALTVGAGALERGRSKKQREAGLAAKEEAYGEQFRAGKKAYEKQLEKLRSTADTTQRTEDAIQAEKEAAEALLAGAEKRGQEGRADIASAAASGDPRSAAGLLNVLERAGAGDDAARLQALQMKAGAEKTGAALAEQNKAFKTALEKELMDRAGASTDEARKTLLDLQTAKEAAGPAATADAMQTATALGTLLKDFDLGNPGGGSAGEDPDKVSGFLDFLGGLSTKNNGGKIKYEAGGYMGEKGFKTKGEFSHKTNKKAVIDEENGEKEAELTGGELVFNPDQTGKMEGFIKKGDEKGLLKFMKDLLSKPQFQD